MLSLQTESESVTCHYKFLVHLTGGEIIQSKDERAKIFIGNTIVTRIHFQLPSTSVRQNHIYHNDKKQTRIVNENEMYEIYEN